MIFAVATDDRSLTAFLSIEDAVASCEGIDVEAAGWLFWDDRGMPLEPVFSTPNKRGLFSVKSGTYDLVPARANHHASLEEALDEIASYESAAPFHSAEAVRAYINRSVLGA